MSESKVLKLRPGLLLAWLLPIIACLLQWSLRDQLQALPWFFFFLPVLLAPWVGGVWGGIGATVFAILLGWYFILPPQFSLALADPIDTIRLVLFAAFAFGYNWLLQQFATSRSQRRRAEVALRASEERLRYALDAANAGWWDVNLAAGTQFVNERWYAQLGIAPGEMPVAVEVWQQAVHPDDRERVQATRSAYLAGASASYAAEYRVVTPAGEIRWNRSAGKIVERSADGRPTRMVGTTTDITDRKRAEEALRQSEARFARFFASSPIPLAVLRLPDSVIIDVNAAFVREFGYARADLLGRPEHELGLLPENVRWAAVETMQEQGQIESMELPVTCRSGAVKECLVAVELLRLAGASLLLVSAVDISERKRLEAALRASETRLEIALQAANEGWWDVNWATGETHVDGILVAQFGYAPGEIEFTHADWLAALHPDDAPHVLQMLNDYRLGRSTANHVEHRVFARSGEVRWHLTTGKLVEWDASGIGTRIVGTITDITERKLAEQRLRDSEERFRLVVENSPSPIAVWDETATIQYLSPTIPGLVGVTQEQIREYAGQVAKAAAAAQMPGEAQPLFTQAGAGAASAEGWLETVQAIIYCIRHPGEKRSVELLVAVQAGELRNLQVISQGFERSSSGVEVVAILHDITEHRALARLLQEHNAELERLVAARTEELHATVAELQQANAGKDAFMAAVSHELRTPLMGILSMSEVLEDRVHGPLTEGQAKSVTLIHASGQRLLATVNSILLYTKAMSGSRTVQPEPCSLADLTAAAIRGVMPAADEKRQSVTRVVRPYDLVIVSDAQSILQVLRVLLDNASKFTPAGGQIDVAVDLLPGATAVQIAIADTGIGMSEAEIAGLFRPFSQGDKGLARRYNGLGLGLAYVYKLVQALGGSIAVQSTVGQGSRFTVTLPVQSPALD